MSYNQNFNIIILMSPTIRKAIPKRLPGYDVETYVHDVLQIHCRVLHTLHHCHRSRDGQYMSLGGWGQLMVRDEQHSRTPSPTRASSSTVYATIGQCICLPTHPDPNDHRSKLCCILPLSDLVTLRNKPALRFP